MITYTFLLLSVLINLLLGWYIIKLLRKFIFISTALADLYLVIKAFRVFVKSLYSMDSYHGEPMIQELIVKLREVGDEMEIFREVFEYALDYEIEEELQNAEEEITKN